MSLTEIDAKPGSALREKYEAVIGIECHVELKTKSKMFCGCPNEFGGEPNTKICPVCLALPGALPVPNRHAIELMITAGLAFGAEIPVFSNSTGKLPIRPAQGLSDFALPPFWRRGRFTTGWRTGRRSRAVSPVSIWKRTP